MSTKAQAILDEIKALPPQEVRAVWQQLSQMAAGMETSASPTGRVSEGDFEAALDEVTGCTAGNGGLRRLLEDRRRDRERDEARLEARQRGRTRG